MSKTNTSTSYFLYQEMIYNLLLIDSEINSKYDIKLNFQFKIIDFITSLSSFLFTIVFSKLWWKIFFWIIDDHIIHIEFVFHFNKHEKTNFFRIFCYVFLVIVVRIIIVNSLLTISFVICWKTIMNDVCQISKNIELFQK